MRHVLSCAGHSAARKGRQGLHEGWKSKGSCGARAGRVQAIEGVMRELRGGDLKLRVRALEVERAARRASILQVKHGPVWIS